MSDYRDPNEPPWRGAEYEPTTRGKDISWGWIAGVVAIVVLVAIAFGVGHSPTETASNETSSAATKAPPSHASTTSDESGASRLSAAAGARKCASPITNILRKVPRKGAKKQPRSTPGLF